jgi:hypothetical protein
MHSAVGISAVHGGEDVNCLAFPNTLQLSVFKCVCCRTDATPS